MKRSRVDILCEDLGIKGNARKLLILFCDQNDVTVEEIIDHLYKDDPEGGPLNAEGYIRVLISDLRKKLKGRVSIKRRSTYELQPIGVIKKDWNDE